MVGPCSCATRARFRTLLGDRRERALARSLRTHPALRADAGVHLRRRDECFAESVYSRKQLTVTLDPLDPNVLRLVGENGEARYLRRQRP